MTWNLNWSPFYYLLTCIELLDELQTDPDHTPHFIQLHVPFNSFLLYLSWNLKQSNLLPFDTYKRMSCKQILIRHHYRDQTWFFMHNLTFARSWGRCWKSRPLASVFNTSLGTWQMLIHWKTMFDRYYCIKTENICYISRYFLYCFVSPFYRCLANTISTANAHSRAGQYTSRNISKYVTPIRSYWKLSSRALTAGELIALLIHGFLPVNARLLITCDTAFYTINCIQTLNILSYLSWNMNQSFSLSFDVYKTAEWVANSVDPDQMLQVRCL